jgi:DNA-directed RNA polymerase specialized sigma24 family protein
MSTSLNEYIVKRYDHLLKVANGLCRNNEGGDLLHTVIDKVYMSYRQSAEDALTRGTLDNYLARALRNEHMQRHRDEARKVELSDNHEPKPTWNGARIDNELLDAAVDLSQLSTLEIKVWRLHVDHGYSVKEIASGSDVTERYIYVVMERARQKIKKVIKKR